MIEIPITPETRYYADFESEKIGVLKNSITEGKGNLAGYIGKKVVADYLGVPVNPSTDFDMVYDGNRINVKTKRTNYPPSKVYECSIAAFNTNQQCDWYVFTRVHNDLSRAWILGYMGKHEYFATARFLKKGDYDHTNRFQTKADCYNVSIMKLHDLKPANIPAPQQTTFGVW